MKPFVWVGYATGKLVTPRKGAETAVYLAANTVDFSGLYGANKAIRTHNPIADQDYFCQDFWDWSLGLTPEV